MEGRFLHRSTAAVVFVALLARAAIAAQKPFATVMSDDGTQYFFYRTESSITASAAAATCAAAGATLASLTSADQVLSTLWSPEVVEAAAEETVLLWTGLKLTWPTTTTTTTVGNHHHRRLLRSMDNDMDDDDDIHGLTLLERLATEMDASTDFVVPTHTHDGRRRLPQLLRLWLFQQHHNSQSHVHSQSHAHAQFATRRSLLARDGASPYLNDAKLSWADGSETSFVMSNTANMGFLACNPKKCSECCGAVFDIGPDPYPGSDFPTIFFYPCGAEKFTGAKPPAGFICAAAPAVAELPKPTATPAKAGSSPSPSPSPSPSSSPSSSSGPATPKCKPGSAPAAKPSAHVCVKCKAGMYSPDGTKCKKCPHGMKSGKGAAACQ